MDATIEAKWINAQVGERRFHCDEVPGWWTVAQRREREAEMRAWYAGMVRIPYLGTPDRTVTDFCCGPESLLLLSPVVQKGYAVDPLKFSEEDETRYLVRGIERWVVPAERYNGPETDEAWCYNGLQHVMDWKAVLAAMARTARKTIRLFEWVEVPTDALHLHTLHEADIRNALMNLGFRERLFVRGESGIHPEWKHQFYAAVWERQP